MDDEPSQARPESIFDVQRVRQFVELMEQFELTEIDLREHNQRIRLRRGSIVSPSLATAPLIGPPVPLAPPAVPPASPTAAPASPDLAVIKSPMVGTFYLRPTPESESFVKVGDTIGPDSVVCIIEAMKVFNEIRAEMSGKVVAVLVENEEPVDFGKPLFKIDTRS